MKTRWFKIRLVGVWNNPWKTGQFVIVDQQAYLAMVWRKWGLGLAVDYEE